MTEMLSGAEVTESDWALEAFEAAARAMYIHKNWKSAILETEGQVRDKSYYQEIVGGYWDSGLADAAQYIEFRDLAAVATLASLPKVISAVDENRGNCNTLTFDEAWAKLTARHSPIDSFKKWVRSRKISTRA